MPTKQNTGVINVKTKRRSSRHDEKKKELPVYVPNVPEPTCRAELLQYWVNLSFDDKTANKMLWISEGGSKATRRKEEVCPVLDRPERFEYPRCCVRRASEARGYWEVECSGWLAVGVCQEGACRRAQTGPNTGLGGGRVENQDSWGLCWGMGSYTRCGTTGLTCSSGTRPFSAKLAEHVDRPASVICFYVVLGEGAERSAGTLLHRFTGPTGHKLLPGVWVGMQSTAAPPSRRRRRRRVQAGVLTLEDQSATACP